MRAFAWSDAFCDSLAGKSLDETVIKIFSLALVLLGLACFFVKVQPSIF